MLKIQIYNISTKRTARYFTLGEFSQKTKKIWFVLHGYGQLAENFIKSFEELIYDYTFIVAPEALSHFYLNSGYSDIGASWMTKEDRENEINDYVNYLDEVYFKIISSHNLSGLQVNALGFSQGSATLSRWIALGKAKFDKVVFWAGEIAKDNKYDKLKDLDIHLVFGTNDRYFPGNYYKLQEDILKSNEIMFKTHIFEGGHEVKIDVVRTLEK